MTDGQKETLKNALSLYSKHEVVDMFADYLAGYSLGGGYESLRREEFRLWLVNDLNRKMNSILDGQKECINAFIAGLRSLNYVVDYRVLCAADYGAPGNAVPPNFARALFSTILEQSAA